MAEQDRISPDEISQREPVEEGAVADGDAQLDQEPPNVTEAEPPPAAEEADAEAQQIESDFSSLRRELSAASDRYLRLAAEFDNYRKRIERERTEAWGRAQADLAGRLLDTLDDLERFRQHSAGATVDSLVQGVQMVEKKLRQSLAAAGLEDVDAEGAVFDPNTMEAVAMLGTDSRDEDDVVADVFQRGYSFKGTLLRPARVRVKKHGA
ncbi:MAG TPA: nucleotide exchange factor GrpE [Longimicrobiales bacterium]|nr:nucleotide exchange factor GrpE [Longimicrobiales bacterium]